MKKTTLLFLGLSFSFISFGQYNTQWYYPSTLNTAPSGYIGIGTKNNSGVTNTPLPAFNLHLHGTADYLVSDAQAGLKPIEPDTTISGDSPQVKTVYNYGKTTRLGLTNLTTGMTETDGSVFRMSGNDLFITNQEVGAINLSTQNIGFILSGATNRIWMGGTVTTASNYARMNMYTTSDNGIYIQTTGVGKYGLRVKVRSGADALQVFDESGVNKNFKVSSEGYVFARKYTTTLSSIPDYVFASDYALMTFQELRDFISVNKHLPNVPSAKEYEIEGVDLGEMNRVLLEKVEELTLYILQLEERMSVLESTKK